MSGCISHRGPSGDGFFLDAAERVYFGHRRLAVIDLAGGGQPMSTADGLLTLIYNGEIYNHLELRAELEAAGHVFQTDHSDTEVVLHGWRAWGPALFARMNGMWAFALFDRSSRRLILSRDRFGKKPLFYAAGREAFVFGSELTALEAHPSVGRGLDLTALQKFFAYGYIPAPYSILAGVRKLPGGCWLDLDLSTLEHKVQRYWQFQLEPFETIPAQAGEVWGEQLRALLEAAVRRRLMSDVPLGVFLSGGVDSAAVTAYAAKHTPAGRLKTFCIGFDDPTFDERAPARLVADHFQTDHHVQVLSMERGAGLLPEILARLDEPLGDSSLLPTYLLSGFARQTVTVALGGDGGDELFAGYDPFRALAKAKWYERLMPKPVHEGVRMLLARLPVSHRNMSLDFKLKRTLRGLSYRPALWAPTWMASVDPAQIGDLFGQRIELEDLYSEAIEAWEACPGGDLIDRTLQFYTRLYLQDDILVKADRASMMHGLEVRAPFLDIELVDFVRRLPSSFKLRGGRTKALLKEALAPVVPAEVLARSKKGFGVPIGRWFKEGGLRVDPDAVAPLASGFVRARLEDHLAGRADERAFLWNCYVWSAWKGVRP